MGSCVSHEDDAAIEKRKRRVARQRKLRRSKRVLASQRHLSNEFRVVEDHELAGDDDNANGSGADVPLPDDGFNPIALDLRDIARTQRKNSARNSGGTDRGSEARSSRPTSFSTPVDRTGPQLLAHAGCRPRSNDLSTTSSNCNPLASAGTSARTDGPGNTSAPLVSSDIMAWIDSTADSASDNGAPA